MSNESIGFTAREARDMILKRLEYIAASMSELHDDFILSKAETRNELSEMSHRIAMHESVPAHATTVMTLGEHKLRMDQMDREMEGFDKRLSQQTETRAEGHHDLARYFITTTVGVLGVLFAAGGFWVALLTGLIKQPAAL